MQPALYNSGQKSDSVRDRRVRKTRQLLHGALGSLISEKAYDAISVQEILDRANVGRSTFYTHFRDKDELLADSIRDMLPSFHPSASTSDEGGYERIVGFGRLIFEHHDGHRRTREDRMGAKGRAVLHEHLRTVLARWLQEALDRDSKGDRAKGPVVPASLLAQYIASTFVLVLNHWIESRGSLPAKDADELFRSLAIPALQALNVRS